MPSFAAMLKDEITRLSRKEVRKQSEPLRKAVSTYRRQIASLKRDIAQLQRLTKVRGAVRARAAEGSASEVPRRFVAKGLRTFRARLGLSASEFGTLAGGVSAQSVYNWESEKSTPRPAQVAVLSELRALNKREARQRLDELLAKPAKRAGKRINR